MENGFDNDVFWKNVLLENTKKVIGFFVDDKYLPWQVILSDAFIYEGSELKGFFVEIDKESYLFLGRDKDLPESFQSDRLNHTREVLAVELPSVFVEGDSGELLHCTLRSYTKGIGKAPKNIGFYLTPLSAAIYRINDSRIVLSEVLSAC